MNGGLEREGVVERRNMVGWRKVEENKRRGAPGEVGLTESSFRSLPARSTRVSTPFGEPFGRPESPWPRAVNSTVAMACDRLDWALRSVAFVDRSLCACAKMPRSSSSEDAVRVLAPAT